MIPLVLLLLGSSATGFVCNFDSGFTPCGFVQAPSDQFDWTLYSGSTPSYYTGPSAGASGSGNYMYIETSSPRVQGDNAKLVKSGLSFTTKMCLSFYYHMYGASIDKLDVNVGQTNVFTKSGDQGNRWHHATVQVMADPGASELIFEASRGYSYTGDIAIDNVELTPGDCPVICDFDSNYCSFSQEVNDDFDWTQNSGGTPSYATGPSGDHTSGSGNYMYIETSSPRIAGDKAVLKYTTQSSGCFSFYYHMKGASMGKLNVFVNGVKEFSKSGNQGVTWNKAQVNVSSSDEIKFEGIRGSSYTGDIAIDDIELKPGSCPSATGSCGIRPHTRIVGGAAATHGDWPWQAMLRTSSGFPYCGGTLVAPQWVVTATHCVTGKSPSSVFVRLGAHKRVNTVGTEQDFAVTNVITHPSYHSPKRGSHDIALLKLATPAQLNKNVNPACLPDAVDAPPDGTNCWITGWGTLSAGGSVPDILQQVQVPVVSRARCDTAYPNLIHDSMICAGLDQGGIDSCQGDSGGPMVCESGGRFYLHGVTSWGYGCASAGRFGVYAKVKYLLNWVNNEMSNN